MALTVLKPSYKSESLNNISNSNAALLYRKCGILLKKKHWAMGGGGCITRWFRCGRRCQTPQLQYNNIIHVLVFRWRNDWLVGLQPFFFFFFFNKKCRRAKQCWMSMWRELPEYPDSRTTFKAWKNSYTGITYFKILS